MDFLRKLFATDFMPHGHCYLWQPEIVWLHVVSDSLITLAYYSIPVALVCFLRKRKDIPFNWMIWMFGGFIFACGTTHLMNIWTLWVPTYRLDGVVKLCTAALSMTTAVLLWPLIPKALALPSPAQLESANKDLQLEILERRRAETELSRAAEELTRSEAQTRSILETAFEAFISMDSQGRITGWNAQAETTFGWSREEAIGRPLETMIPQHHREAHLRGLARFLQTGEGPGLNKRMELTALHRDGREIPVEILISPLRLGDTLTFNTFLHDITERKSAEAQLLRTKEQAESSNRELEAFSYSVSHDLRAPLRTIDGFSLALMEDCADELNERGRQHLERVRSATQRMGQLIDDLLSLSHIARVEMRRTAVNLSDLARRVADELQKGQPERRVDIAIAEDLVADGDGRLLRVALENLLRNAWKFTSKRPVAHIEFGASQDDGRRSFFVRDDGAGFDMEYAGKLFGAFQRLHSAKDFEGTGIGLATVARIVQRHGGRVWAEGAVDQGATFHFTL
jgi:PAS domain S-box-containing protein